MSGVISIIAVLLLWRFLIVFGTVVFEAAGLSRRDAEFEARSAIVGAGYTTGRSEVVVGDPSAQRVASLLIVTGYFGPATVLALLGFSFVVPSSDDLDTRIVVLVGLLAVLYATDRIGLVRAVASRPSRALARRIIGRSTFETWIVVGDQAVASLVVPADAERAAATAAALRSPDVTVLAVEPAVTPVGTSRGDPPASDPGSGDRVVVFGARHALEPLGRVD